MNLRLKTNAEIESKLSELQTWLHFSSKAVVMRLALSYSLKDKTDPRLAGDAIKGYDVKKQDGADYLRLTVFGQDEEIYRLLIVDHLGRRVDEDEFFPELVNAHIERGIRLMHSEYRLLLNREKFMSELIGMSEKP